MAIQTRIIPVLLLHKGGLYKTKQFKNPSYMGDPINADRIFNEKEVDELLILDIDCSKENKEPNYSLIEEIVSEAFMPVGYGVGF
jgi:cyclase